MQNKARGIRHKKAEGRAAKFWGRVDVTAIVGFGNVR